MHPSPISRYSIAVDKLDIKLKQHEMFSALCDLDLTTLRRSASKDSYKFGNVELLKLTDRETIPNYHLGFQVYLKDILIGNLFTDYTKFYQEKEPLIKLQVNKNILYNTGWYNLLDKVFTNLNLIFNNISYVELALDTDESAQNNFYYFFDNPDAYYFLGGNRLRSSMKTVAEEYRDGTVNKTLYVGKSDVQVIIYNKTLELQNNPNKYITALHVANGLDITKIQRIELALRGTALVRYVVSYEYLEHNKDNNTTNIIYLTDYQYNKLDKYGKDYYYKMDNGRIVDINKKEININYYNSLSDKSKMHCRKVTDKKKTGFIEDGETEREMTLEDLANSNFLFSLYSKKFPIQFKLKDDSNISRCTEMPFIDFSTAKIITSTTSMKLESTNNLNMNKNNIKQNLKQYKLTELEVLREAAETIAKRASLMQYYDEQYLKLELNKKKINPYQLVSVIDDDTNLAGLFN